MTTARLTDNAAALRVLEQGRTDPAALAILAGYSGQGGVGASTDEYFTPAALAQAICERITPLLRAAPRVLEPSCGTGVFIAGLNADAQVTGVEVSSVSASIARLLRPHATIHNLAFEQYVTSTPDAHASFDLVIGNTPFGTRRTAGLDLPNIREASRYFLTRSLQFTRPGGLLALILPNGITRHAASTELRRELLRQVDVLAALGLSTDAFAGTGAQFATTDLLILRRRTPHTQALLTVDDAALRLVTDDPFNAAFLRGQVHALHPEWLAGPEVERRGYAGRMIYCRDGSLDDTVRLITQVTLRAQPDTLTSALNRAQEYDVMPEPMRDRWNACLTQLLNPTPKPGANRMQDGQLQVYYRKWHTVSAQLNITAQSLTQLGRGVRAHAEALAFTHDRQATDLRGKLLPALERLHRDVITHHKDLRRLSRFDPNLLAGLTAAETPVPVLPDAQPGEANLIREAYQDVRTTDGIVTTDRVAAHLNVSEDAVTRTLTQAGYLLSSDGWLTPSDYFTGFAGDRLADIATLRRLPLSDAERTALDEQERQVQRAAQGHTLDRIPIHPRTPFISGEMLQGWVDTTYAHLNATVIKLGDEVTVEGAPDPKETRTFNYLRRYLTGRGRRKDELQEYTGSDELLRAFIIREYGPALRTTYNASTAYLTPQYDTGDVSVDIPWYQGPTPHPNQNEAARRGQIEGAFIDAQDVGLGKTLTGLLHAGLTFKETGRMTVITVPRGLLLKWGAAARGAYPDLDVRVIEYTTGDLRTDAHTLSRALREAVRDRAAIVILSHDTFSRIRLPGALTLELLTNEFRLHAGERPANMSDSMYGAYALAQVDAWLADGSVTEDDLITGPDTEHLEHEATLALVDTDVTLTRAQRAQHARKLRFIASRGGAANTDVLHPLDIQWTELDVGLLITDEAHRMRRILTASGRMSIKYLSAPTDSALRAVDHFLKVRHLQQHGRGVHLLTATPVYNSLTDLYNIIHLARPDLFPAYGVCSLDAFIEQYAETEIHTLVDEDGEEQQVEVMVGVAHVTELQEIIRLAIHRRTAADVGMHVPRVQREYHLHDVDDDQERVIQAIADDPIGAVQQYIRPDLKLSPSERDDRQTLERYRFAVSGLLRKAEMDLGMLDPASYPDHVSPKVREGVARAAQLLKDGKKFVIFCDLLRFPEGAHLQYPNMHAKIAALISAASGLPAGQIGLINGMDTPDPDLKYAVSEGFNEGTLRGVIGTRAGMGEGVDLQTDSEDIIGLDVPYTPGMENQSVGRVARYPNRAEVINVHYHLSNRALDPHMLDVLSGKLSWYDQLLSAQEDHLRVDFGARAPTVEEIMTLRLRNRGEREAALRDLRERDAHATAHAQRRAELRSAERYQDALRALTAAQRAQEITGRVDQALLERLQSAVDVHSAPLRHFQSVPAHAVTGPDARTLVHRGQAFDVGAVLEGESKPTRKYDTVTRYLGTITAVDVLEQRITIDTLPDPAAPFPRAPQSITLVVGDGLKLRVTTLREYLSQHPNANHAKLHEVYRAPMQALLADEYRQKGQAAFVLRDGAVVWDRPRLRDTLITRWMYAAHQADITAFLNTPEGRVAAANLAPDTAPGLYWTVPETPHGQKLMLEQG